MTKLVKTVDNKYVQIEEYKNPNICFNTNKYDNFKDYCTLKETFDPFEIFYENQELKKKYENAVVDYETTMAENKELKKQVENKYEKVGTLTNELLYEENTKLINQQKEFINYLNSYIDLLNDKPDMLEETQKDILEEILQKYKEIIGVKDEKK